MASLVLVRLDWPVPVIGFMVMESVQFMEIVELIGRELLMIVSPEMEPSPLTV